MKKWAKKVVISVLVLGIGYSANAVSWIWDGSTDAGYQNTNGTWGSDSYWTAWGNGETLQAWPNTADDQALFGANGAVPSGDFTVTVSGTQTAKEVRQYTGSVADYTLNGGSIIVATAAGVRVDAGTFTVNSDISTSVDFMNLHAEGGDLVLGGNNTFAANVVMRGVDTNSVKLANANALGGADYLYMVTTLQMLDLNGLAVSSPDIKINNGKVGYIGNTSASGAEFSGDIIDASGMAYLYAGGSDGEVNLSGVIGVHGSVSVKDGTTLRLSGANTYDVITVVRNFGTLIVDNASALGTTNGITYVQGLSTLDLNGYDIGMEEINLQFSGAELLNNAGTAAAVGGAITLRRPDLKIGGSGDLVLSGTINGGTDGLNGFSKTGEGSLTLSGTNTYIAATVVDGGELVGGSGAFAESVSISVSNSAALILQDASAMNDLVMLASGTTAALGLDFSGTQTVAGLSLDGGTSWLDNGAYNAAQLGTLNPLGTYTGSGTLNVMMPAPILILPGNTNLVASWMSKAGTNYTVETTGDLVIDPWVAVESNKVGTGGWLNYTDEVSATKSFYRFIEE